MKLNVEIETSSFEKIIKDGLESLPKEELKEILKQVILETFNKNNAFHGALITRVKDGYYSSNERVVLGPLAEAAVKDIDFGPELDRIKKIMLDDLSVHYREILERAVLSVLLDKFAMHTAFSTELESRIRSIFHDIREKERN